MLPRRLSDLLSRIRTLATRGHVRFTYKALRELSQLGIGLDEDDACDILVGLTQGDFEERIASEHTGEWMYVFKPVVAGITLYLKVVIRNDCIVISLHEDEVSHEQEEQ